MTSHNFVEEELKKNTTAKIILFYFFTYFNIYIAERQKNPSKHCYLSLA